MKNIRHISIYNEFFLTSQFQSVAPYTYNVTKNLNVIQLIKSKNYRIKNLTVDIGGTNLVVKNMNFDGTEGIAFPFRFILDENPLVGEYERLKQIYPTMQFAIDGSVISSVNQLKEPNSLDIVDSSNVYRALNKYFNTINLIYPSSSPVMALQLAKSQTVAEYNFFNFSYNKIEQASTPFYSIIINNNPINDFYFNSKNFEYLVFSLYPFLRYFIAASGYQFILNTNFTVNFDLEELD